MLISDTQKFVFIHNPKCAGTTVRQNLMAFDSRNDFYWEFADVDGIKIDKAHLTQQVFRRFRPDDFALLEHYFTFGFVRNPYRRFISAFNETHPTIYKESKESDAKMIRYLEKISDFAVQLEKNKLMGYDIKLRHCVLQSNMFIFAGKNNADLILKLESMESEIEKLALFNPVIYENSKKWLQAKNKKPMNLTAERILTPKAAEKIRDVYSDDFLLFDYDMDDLAV